MPSRLITEAEHIRLSLMTIGQRMRYIREQLRQLYGGSKYSTTDLARIIGVTSQSLTSIERGETVNPSFKVVNLVARSFNIPIDVLTDEYYQSSECRLFSIGFDDDALLTKPAQVSETDELSFRIGVYVYQLFDNDEMRIVFSKNTDAQLDVPRFIQVLARIYAEMQCLDAPEDITKLEEYTDQSNPYKSAWNLYNGVLEFPNSFPRGSTAHFAQLLNQFHDVNRQSKEGEE